MQFNYQARTKKGKIQTGAIEASSKEAAIVLLQKHEFFVTSLEKVEVRPFYTRKIKLFERISRKEMALFSRQLSMMFKSQIPLVETLLALANQTKNQGFKEKILTLSEEIKGGSSFSQSLNRYPKLFSSFYINMVKSGEISGTLSKSLEYLADHLEREYYLLAKIRGAMIYPALIVVVVIGVLIMMMFFVIPNLARVLTETGQELPFLTKIIINFSAFARTWWWALTLVLVGISVFLFRYFGGVNGRKFRDRLILEIPIMSSFLEKIYISRFAENLSTLITGGLPIVGALEITGEVVGNDVYRSIILQIKEEVKKGEQISSVLVRYQKQFPSLLIQMFAVGEKTGTLDKSLTNVVDFYQKEVERSIDNLLGILEPLLVVFLGLVVAGLMAAILMPLYKMTAI